MTSHHADQVKTLEIEDGRVELRAATDYGRIFDHELVSAVQRIAGNGTGDTRWKVPGVLDWSTGIYNPRVDVTQDTTTLYASERLSELETALEGFETRPVVFDPAEIARAGAFVSIGADGHLRVERGYLRPEDELPIEPDLVSAEEGEAARAMAASYEADEAIVATEAAAESEEDEGLSPISDRLMTELTSHRTLGLRHALGERPDVAFIAALHVLTLRVRLESHAERASLRTRSIKAAA